MNCYRGDKNTLTDMDDYVHRIVKTLIKIRLKVEIVKKEKKQVWTGIQLKKI